jgi:hypothetical protein
MADVINNLIVKLSWSSRLPAWLSRDLASAYKVGHRIAMLYDAP